MAISIDENGYSDQKPVWRTNRLSDQFNLADVTP